MAAMTPAESLGACLPCPFCGAPAAIDRGGFGEVFVACSKCWCHMGGAWHTTEAAAIAAWNRRTHGPALLAALRLREWVPVSERLPEINEPVAVIDVKRRENTGGGGHDRYVQDCAYLSDFGGKYWWTRGRGGVSVDAYTHWMPLPAPPTADDLARVLEESATGDEAASC